MKKENKKGNGSFVPMLIFIFIGAICGGVMTSLLDGIFEKTGFFFGLAAELLILALSYYVQLIVHEAGHLVAGLISGYSFSSFRIGNVMILKENGKLTFKKHSLAGTGGQCLMCPPEMKEGKYPVIFYNLGGVLMNIASIPVLIALAFAFRGFEVLLAFFAMSALSAFAVAATNGIPLKLGMVNNDGSNARELYKNREAMLIFYNQFKIVDETSRGVRLRDMPREWFPMPSSEGMNNSITVSGAVFLENRLIDEGDLDGALALTDRLLEGENALIGLHRNLLIGDKITVELLKGRGQNAQELYKSKEYQAFAKQMKGNISVIRTQYAIALLGERDNKKAEQLLTQFEKCARTHPYKSDIESERDMMNMVDNLACKK